jgi:ABC-2 type transport system permease protein
MVLNRIRNILVKEWRLLFTDLSSFMMITLLPLLIIGQGVLYVWLAYKFGGDQMLTMAVFQAAIEKLTQAVPGVISLSVNDQLLVLLLNQVNFYLLLVPAMIAVNAATFSIVDEKQTGSLEALLATPVRTWELLLGKALAGAVPALVMTWICAGIFLLVTAVIGWGDLNGYVVNASWALTLFLLTPAVAMFSFILGVVGSSRAKDAKSAQNFVAIIILPVFALVGIQVTGIVWFTPLLTLALALVLIAIDVLMLRLAVRLFRRESILVQWR